MYEQHRIPSTLSDPEPLARVKALMAATGSASCMQAQRGIWNELMRSEHPRGAVQHVGAQLRYLLVSDHGVLGALGFAAAALTLAARDTFI